MWICAYSMNTPAIVNLIGYLYKPGSHVPTAKKTVIHQTVCKSPWYAYGAYKPGISLSVAGFVILIIHHLQVSPAGGGQHITI